MAKIKVYNRGYIFDRSKVEDFITRINGLIGELQAFDMDVEELERCKEGIIKSKCYSSRDIWFIENIEDTVERYLHDNKDFPF